MNKADKEWIKTAHSLVNTLPTSFKKTDMEALIYRFTFLANEKLNEGNKEEVAKEKKHLIDEFLSLSSGKLEETSYSISSSLKPELLGDFQVVNKKNLMSRTQAPLELKIETLKQIIKAEISNSEKRLKYLISSNEIGKNEQIYSLSGNIESYKEIYSLPINSERDYDYVCFLFNNGNLRTIQEINLKNNELQELKYSDIRSSSDYNKGYHPILYFLAWFFGLPLVVELFTECKTSSILGFLLSSLTIWAIGFIAFAIIAAVMTLIYCELHSRKFDIPLDSKTVGAIVGATATGITTYVIGSKVASHNKQSYKEI